MLSQRQPDSNGCNGMAEAACLERSVERFAFEGTSRGSPSQGQSKESCEFKGGRVGQVGPVGTLRGFRRAAGGPG